MTTTQAGAREGKDRARHYACMASVYSDPRTRHVPEEIRQYCRRLLAELGPRVAAKKLGISRTALLSVTSGANAMPGTVALITLALQRQGKVPAP